MTASTSALRRSKRSKSSLAPAPAYVRTTDGLQGPNFAFGVGEKAAEFLAMGARAGELARPSPVGWRSQGFGNAPPQMVEAGGAQLLDGRGVLGRGRSQQVADGWDERPVEMIGLRPGQHVVGGAPRQRGIDRCGGVE